MTEDGLLNANVFGSGKGRTSKAVRAETGSDGSTAKSLLDERTRGTRGRPRRQPESAASDRDGRMSSEESRDRRRFNDEL
jgi:hypothetical protein